MEDTIAGKFTEVAEAINLVRQTGKVDLYMHFDDLIVITIAILGAFVVPGVLTVWNIYNCLARRPKHEKLIATLTVLIGGFLYLAWQAVTFQMSGDWNEQIYPYEVHNSIASRYSWLVVVVLLLGFAGYFVLLYVEGDKLPPLVSVFAVAALAILNVFLLMYAIQLSNHFKVDILFLYIYHLNVLLLSARVIFKHLTVQLTFMREKKDKLEEHRRLKWMYFHMEKLSDYGFWIFMVLFFVIAVAEIILLLAGQGLDAPVKMFTDTADWTFSKQLPPPPAEFDGHYLCTVAAGGHRRIVKPLRYGHRRGERIVVNRQLCIANAFEELIQEKCPHFHRRIRCFYDTCGYPVSRHITNPYRADLVYVLMKPLEWCFLLFLYFVDVHPERRIGRQYL